MTVNFEELLSTSQAAEYLGVRPQTLYDYVEKYQIGRKVGKQWMFLKSELERFRNQDTSKGGRPRIGLFSRRG